MIITFEGRDWDFDDSHLTNQEAIAFYEEFKLTLADYAQGLRDLDPRAYTCAYWLMLRQGGDMQSIKKCQFDVLAFISAFIAGMKEAGEPEEDIPEDPTQASSSRKGSAASPARSTPKAPARRPRAAGEVRPIAS